MRVNLKFCMKNRAGDRALSTYPSQKAHLDTLDTGDTDARSTTSRFTRYFRPFNSFDAFDLTFDIQVGSRYGIRGSNIPSLETMAYTASTLYISFNI